MNALREQFMERLIREIFQRKGSGFVLKGGAALRSIYGEHRYTKDIDLDFSNPKRTASSLHNTIYSSIEKTANALGIGNTSISRPGLGEKSPRWKINFSAADGTPVHIEVEVSRDQKRVVPGQVVVQPFTPQAAKGIARFWVDVYDQQALIASKLAALLNRGLPRDAYDLDVLHASAQRPTDEQINWALSRTDEEGEDAQALLSARLDAMTWERFQSELRDSLIPEIAERIDADEWSAITKRVADYAALLLKSIGHSPHE